jgi:heterodisulfide reductase subunit A
MDEVRIGVYICHCGANIPGMVEVDDVTEFAASLPNVVVAKHYKFMCSEPGQNLIKEDIKNNRINRVIVASCSPRMHGITFRKVCEEVGLNQYLFQMANIREQCSWVHVDKELATIKAKALVSAAIRRVVFQEPLKIKEVDINPNTLVVGGGIAGIQAALEIASKDKKVYLLEKEPSIGGHMAKFDKTFPTLDCAACILTPKMVQVGQNPNIELLTYAELEEVSGFIGNFKVKIRKKARFVDLSKCNACGDCEKECPVEVDSEFDEKLSTRKAIYRQFPQAVPSAFTIDKKGISACRNACPAKLPIQGYVALIGKGKYEQAYELIKQIVPFPGSLGRVCFHPCESECERGKVDEPVAICALKRFVADKKSATRNPQSAIRNKEKVAIIGSGPAGLTAAYHLNKHGYRVTVFEALAVPGGMLRLGIPEYRLPKKILQQEIDEIIAAGVEIKTNTPIGENLTLADLKNRGYEAIFIATGAHKSKKLSIPGVELDGVINGVDFLRQVNMKQEVKIADKVIVIGGGNVAVDVARTALRLQAKEVHVVCLEKQHEMPAYTWEIEDMLKEGIKLHPGMGPKRILGKEKVAGLEMIKCEQVFDSTGRFNPKFVEGTESVIEAETIIVAIGQETDLSFLDKDIEITPQGTIVVDSVTLQTNIPWIFAGGDVVNGPASVIESAAAGISASISIDRYLKGEDLKADREERLHVVEADKEGVQKQNRCMIRKLSVDERISSFKEVVIGISEEAAQQEAKRCLSCAVCSECLECERVCEPKAIDHNMKDEIIELEVGNIIITTGFELFDCKQVEEYGYGRYNNVINSLEFERLSNAAGPTDGRILLKDGTPPKSVAIIHCVGSRNKKYNEYCSHVCCMYSLKFAHLVHEKVPEAKIYEFYIDMRAAGKGYEEFYNRLLQEGVNFIRGRGAEVVEEKGRLVVKCEDTLLGFPVQIPVDMVILSAGLAATKDAHKLARLFSISIDKNGFFIEQHPKLAPISTGTDGVFIAGACQGPKDIPDTIAQGIAAAGEVLSLISRGKVEVEAATTEIDENICSGCKICIGLCPFTAIEFNEEKKVSVVNDVLCKGCGTCAAACPSGASKNRHFTTQQIFAEIEGVLI